MTDLEKARDAFLNMIADAIEWEEHPDGDVNDAGQMIDCTTYTLRTNPKQLEELVDALGIKRGRTQSLMDAICEAISPTEPSDDDKDDDAGRLDGMLDDRAREN